MLKKPDKVMEFVVFCLEMYAEKHQLSGQVVAERFARQGVIQYLTDCYWELHSMGKEWLLNDIEDYLKAKEIQP